jgi:hypothetical protein
MFPPPEKVRSPKSDLHLDDAGQPAVPYDFFTA